VSVASLSVSPVTRSSARRCGQFSSALPVSSVSVFLAGTVTAGIVIAGRHGARRFSERSRIQIRNRHHRWGCSRVVPVQ